MSDKPTAADVPAEISFALLDLVVRAAHAMNPGDAFAEPGAALHATPAQGRAEDLARLRAIEALRADLESTARMIAHRAGGRAEAPVTYADLGDAVGISRQAARTRFVGAIPDARPGRPPAQVTVYLDGGPSCWDGKQLEMDRDSVYGCDLDDVGGLLMIPDGSYPDHLAAETEGVDWRAHYAPNEEGKRRVWTFQGWVPS